MASEKQWYVVNTYSGHEDKVKVNLERRVVSMGLEDYVFRIIVAETEQPVLKDGIPTGKTKIKNSYPGYVFIEMIMTDDAWFMVRNTPGVTGFVGPGSKPVPLSEGEIRSMGVSTKQQVEIDLEVGDTIKVISGAWADTVGDVKEINMAKQSITIDVDVFGRATPVEIGFLEVQKLN